PAQAGVEGSGEVDPGQPVVVGARSLGHEPLGGDHDRAAFASHPLADALLGLAVVVVPGRVDEVVPGVQEAIDDGSGRCLVDAESPAGAEVHRAQAGPGDLEAGAAQRDVLHRAPPRWTALPPPPTIGIMIPLERYGIWIPVVNAGDQRRDG